MVHNYSSISLIIEVKLRYADAVVEPAHDQLMDEKEFESSMFQRPFQYLQRFNTDQELRNTQSKSNIVEGTPAGCIEVLLRLVHYAILTLDDIYSSIHASRAYVRHYFN